MSHESDVLDDNGQPMPTEQQLTQAVEEQQPGKPELVAVFELEPAALVSLLNQPVELAQCDCCSAMVPVDELHHGYPYGIETFACSRCCGEKE